MLPIKTMKQIPTSRVIASSTAASYWHRQRTQIGDRARMRTGKVQLQISEAHRLWLHQQHNDESSD